MYLRSKRHRENYKKAAALGSQVLSRKREERVAEYYRDPKLCLVCSNPIPYEKKKVNRFCGSSCSASFNNRSRGPHSAKTKEKISIRTRESILGLIEEGVIPRAKILEKKCMFCAEGFSASMSKKSKIFCSKSCKVKYGKTNPEAVAKARLLGRKSVERQMKQGRWKGWSGQGEGVRSYPEKYVEERIVSAGSLYSFQHQVGPYKIDFAFIERMIALEVDGKQHEYPKQKESDLRKDAYISQLGWLVFRLKWKSIKTKSGKAYVDKQIDDFLKLI